MAYLDREAVGIGALRGLDAETREIKRMYASMGYSEIPDYNGNPSANRWFEKHRPELRQVYIAQVPVHSLSHAEQQR